MCGCCQFANHTNIAIRHQAKPTEDVLEKLKTLASFEAVLETPDTPDRTEKPADEEEPQTKEGSVEDLNEGKDSGETSAIGKLN